MIETSQYVTDDDAATSAAHRPFASVCGCPGRQFAVPTTTHASGIGRRVCASTTMMMRRANPCGTGPSVRTGIGVGVALPLPLPVPWPPPFPPPPPPPFPPGPVAQLAPLLPG